MRTLIKLALVALLINASWQLFSVYWSYEAEREDYEEAGAADTVRGLWSVFAHFFTKTRWDRMLHQIR